MIHIADGKALSRWFLQLVLVVALLFTSTSMSRAQSETVTPEHPPAAANKQDLTTKGAMECCKLGMKMAPTSANQSAAMECCELGMKGMPGTSKDSSMQCCKRGKKGAAIGPSTEDPKPGQK